MVVWHVEGDSDATMVDSLHNTEKKPEKSKLEECRVCPSIHAASRVAKKRQLWSAVCAAAFSHNGEINDAAWNQHDHVQDPFALCLVGTLLQYR